MDPRLRWSLIAVAVAAATFAILVWRFAEPDGAQVLRPPPEIPALCRAEFDATPDTRLLDLVQAEGTRRLLAAHGGWGAGRTVLPDGLRHLWTIGAMEADLHQSGFVHVRRLSAASPAMLPPLADLEDAYRAIGQAALADAVAAALAVPDLEAEAPRLDAAFRAAIAAGGLRAQRIAYARRHRDGLVADRP